MDAKPVISRPQTHERNESKIPDIKKLSSLLFGVTCLVVNLTAAVKAPIQDCDEVFNFWEPTHYLSHGFGLQTWEYSPEFAIRSWLYVALHAAISRPLALLGVALGFHIDEFILIRTVLAIICACCQMRLFQAVFNAMGPRVAFILALVVESSTGMFYASVAYLPSSFSMYTTMAGLAALLDAQSGPNTRQGIIWFGIGAIVGWPFSTALIIPLLMDEIIFIRLTGDMKSVVIRTLKGVASCLPLIVRSL